jgi:hypothetical protein
MSRHQHVAICWRQFSSNLRQNRARHLFLGLAIHSNEAEQSHYILPLKKHFWFLLRECSSSAPRKVYVFTVDSFTKIVCNPQSIKRLHLCSRLSTSRRFMVAVDNIIWLWRFCHNEQYEDCVEVSFTKRVYTWLSAISRPDIFTSWTWCTRVWLVTFYSVPISTSKLDE